LLLANASFFVWQRSHRHSLYAARRSDLQVPWKSRV